MFRTAVFLIILGSYLGSTTTFDLSTDFSFQNNPNGVWQYGYSAKGSLNPAEFRIDQYADPTAPVGFWHPSSSSGPGPGWYPYIAYNTTGQTQFGSQKGWAVRAGEVAMEGSSSGQYSMVRFVASKAGTYKIAARFEGVHFGSSTTDVHILHNNAALFDGDIEGYGGDPAFHAVQGTSPTAQYEGQAKLAANDTITFAVGYGKNKTNSCDTTGLFAKVVLLSNRANIR
jgi:hypothetical protein